MVGIAFGVVRRALTGRCGQGLLAALVGVVVASAVHWSGLDETFEARTYDWRAKLLASSDAPRPPICVILVDQQSLDWAARENGLSWPWPREVYGVVLDFCRRAGVRSVALDVLYTEPSKYGVDDDRSMARSARELGRVVVPVFLGRESGDSLSWPDHAPLPGFHPRGMEAWALRSGGADAWFPRAGFPIPELATSAALLGNVHQNPDQDGVYRRVALWSFFDGRAVPSLSLGAYLAAHPGAAAALTTEGLALDGRLLHLDAAAQGLVRYRAPEQVYCVYNAAAVLRSELQLREGLAPDIDLRMLQDAYVFFGFSAPGLFDLRPCPLSGVYSGVEIHAQALGNILEGGFLREPELLSVWVWTCVLAVSAALWCSLGGTIFCAVLAAAVFLAFPVAASLVGYQAGLVVPILFPEMAVAVALAVSVLLAYATEGRQKRFIKNAFKQYLSPAVIEQLVRHPERMRLGGERRVLTIFFSDLQGFTSLSETLSPEELTRLLNAYLTAMTDIIMDEGGTVDKYEGDAIIAFWNAPLDQPDHATRAVRAALRCQARLAELRPVVQEQTGFALYMRIGLNTGAAVVGNMGSQSRFDYTMLGDAVNLAARLEGTNKQFGTFTLMSEAVLAATDGSLAARELGQIRVVGRREAVRVLEPLWPEQRAAIRERLDVFASGLQCYQRGAFSAALREFERVQGEDPAAANYARRCRALVQNPPEGAWDGVWIMTEK